MSRGRRLVVVGAGGHAKVVTATALAAGWTVAALVDDDPSTWGRRVLGIPVLGGTDAIRGVGADGAVLGVGSNRARMDLAGRLDLEWVTVLHPSSCVDPSALLEEGCVVCAGAVIQPDATFGRHAIVNTGATVDHDCQVGRFVHLAPGSHLAGAVRLQEGAFVGIGACVIPGIQIGAWSVVGAGAAVVRDVPPGVSAAGVPARILGGHE